MLTAYFLLGGAYRDRTDDPLRARQVLSQLSYGPNFYKWSGRQDLNLRPPGPKPGALAKLSHTPKLRYRGFPQRRCYYNPEIFYLSREKFEALLAKISNRKMHLSPSVNLHDRIGRLAPLLSRIGQTSRVHGNDVIINIDHRPMGMSVQHHIQRPDRRQRRGCQLSLLHHRTECGHRAGTGSPAG